MVGEPTHKFFWIRNRIKEVQISVVCRPCWPNPLEKLKQKHGFWSWICNTYLRKVHLTAFGKRCEVKEKMTPLSGRVLPPRAPKVGRHVGSCCWSGPAYKSRSASDRSYTPSPGPPRSLASSRASNRVLCNEAGGGGLGTPAWSSRPPTGAILANFYREYKVNTSYLVSRGWAWGEVEANNVKRLCYQWMLHIPELVPI